MIDSQHKDGHFINDIHLAIGDGVTQWSELDEVLASLHFRLQSHIFTGASTPPFEQMQKAYNTANDTFFAIGSMQKRCDLIGKEVRNLYGDEAFKAWNAISSKIEKLQAVRNVMAHGRISGPTGDEPKHYSIISTKLFTTGFYGKYAKNSLTAEEAFNAPAKFRELKNAVQKFSTQLK